MYFIQTSLASLALLFGYVQTTYAFELQMSVEEIEAVTPILQSYTAVSVIVVGVLTIAVVMRNARLMKGGVFGSVLGYFSIGMIFVFTGYLTDAYPDILPFKDAGVLNHSLFILGFLCMAYAASKLSRAIEG
jgi:hypothetical protein